MNWLAIFICHLLLVTISLALPANKLENKSHESTTAVPSKGKGDTKAKTAKEHQVDKNNKKLGKSTLVAKKRDIPQLFEENPEDIYGGKSVEEYAKALALGPSFDNSRIENTILKAETYGDPASINGYRYYGGEDRKKRTAIFDLYNRPGAFSKREILDFTPEEVLTYLAWLQQQRVNYPLPQSRYWSDFDNSIDLSETDLEDEDVYNDNPENRFDLYDRRYPPYASRWGDIARDKRFIVSKRNFLGK